MLNTLNNPQMQPAGVFFGRAGPPRSEHIIRRSDNALDR
jgi:hypothetical protein